MEFPKELSYTKDHEWIAFEKAASKVGVTEYAVEQLGDIVHIELPEVGETFEPGASFGTIESTKTVSDLYMPVKGKIIEINDLAINSPQTLQSDPYDEGWLVKIETAGQPDEGTLLDSSDYESYVNEQDDS